jgi:hypothetical protein
VKQAAKEIENEDGPERKWQYNEEVKGRKKKINRRSSEMTRTCQPWETPRESLFRHQRSGKRVFSEKKTTE